MDAAWMALVGGAAAFAHCLGMCGGFALHLARGGSRWQVLGRQALWHGGRLATYLFLGALAGFLGRWIGMRSGLATAQNVLAYAAGAVMVLMGLALLGLRPRFARKRSEEGEPGLFASVFRQFFGEPSARGALALGVATGFLPCPIVYGFLAFAAQTGSAARGMLVLGAMGVGTIWSLLILGMTGHIVTHRLRHWGGAAAGVVLVALGLATALRGTEAFHRILGCPEGSHRAAPAEAEGGESPGCPCSGHK